MSSRMVKKDKDGNVIAYLVRELRVGECDCYYDDKPNFFVEGRLVYEKVKR